jgi:hypothetical protein
MFNRTTQDGRVVRERVNGRERECKGATEDN